MTLYLLESLKVERTKLNQLHGGAKPHDLVETQTSNKPTLCLAIRQKKYLPDLHLDLQLDLKLKATCNTTG